MPQLNGAPPTRTVLEQKIRERRQTLEEFVDYVEKFRRDHNEPGTLSLRHLERLIAGHRGDGRPLGPVPPSYSPTPRTHLRPGRQRTTCAAISTSGSLLGK